MNLVHPQEGTKRGVVDVGRKGASGKKEKAFNEISCRNHRERKTIDSSLTRPVHQSESHSVLICHV